MMKLTAKRFNRIVQRLPIQDRQVLLAHASAETTKVYTNPNPELARQFVNQIPKFQNVTKT